MKTNPVRESAAESAEQVRRRLYWRCRRGMLELDLLLQGFLENGYDALDEQGRRGFIEMLEFSDQMLLEYFLGRMQPVDRVIADVVTAIRRTAHN